MGRKDRAPPAFTILDLDLYSSICDSSCIALKSVISSLIKDFTLQINYLSNLMGFWGFGQFVNK